MGIIERVEMIDFMCHGFLKFNFGPQINFIIGECSTRPARRNAERGFQTSQVITAVSGQPHNHHPLSRISPRRQECCVDCDNRRSGRQSHCHWPRNWPEEFYQRRQTVSNVHLLRSSGTDSYTPGPPKSRSPSRTVGTKHTSTTFMVTASLSLESLISEEALRTRSKPRMVPWSLTRERNFPQFVIT